MMQGKIIILTTRSISRNGVMFVLTVDGFTRRMSRWVIIITSKGRVKNE